MRLSIGEIALLCKGELDGDSQIFIEGVNPPSLAGQSDLCYIEKTEDLALLGGRKVGCVILNEKDRKGDKFNFPVIWVKNPKLAFASVLREIDREKLSAFNPGISPHAFVSPKAKIAASAHIGPFCFIGEDAEIGENSILVSGVYIGNGSKIGNNCLLYSNVSVREGCLIGNFCILHCGCVIGSDGYGYAQSEKGHIKIAQIGGVKIGDNVEIGANTCIDRATMGFTEIGDGCKIDNLVHIAHNVKTGRNCLIIAQAGIAGSSKIGNNVIIAGQAGISDHVEIGDNSIIMAKTGVMGKVKPGSILFGYLGRPRGEYMRIEALLSKLPEFFNFYKKAKKKLDSDEKNAG